MIRTSMLVSNEGCATGAGVGGMAIGVEAAGALVRFVGVDGVLGGSTFVLAAAMASATLTPGLARTVSPKFHESACVSFVEA